MSLTYALSLFQLPYLFLISLNAPSFILALKLRMARLRAAALLNRRRLRVLVSSYIPIRLPTVSAGSPSCTALTVTMSFHQSPCLETHPLLVNCECNRSLMMDIISHSVVISYTLFICLLV